MIKKTLMAILDVFTQPLFDQRLNRLLKETVPTTTAPVVPQPLPPTPAPKKGTPTTAPIPTTDTTTLPAITDFLKAEIHLETIGFFTPVKNRSTIRHTKKTIAVRGTYEGKKVEKVLSIVPSAEYGFPVTSDLDMYRAFQKILSGYIREQGQAPQHIAFTSAQLLKLMGKERQKGGVIYREIKDWLRRMHLTGIVTDSAIYDGSKKRFAGGTFQVFNHTLTYGQELDDGTIADRHHVWLSDWYLANVNQHRTEPIDYTLYKALTKPIAKALIGILKEGFLAGSGTMNKRYDGLCTLLGIATYKAISDIQRQLDSAHRELAKQGYLKPEPNGWVYTKSSDGTTYVITWTAGPRYYQEQEAQRQAKVKLTSKAKALPSPIAAPNLLITQLTAAGIGQATAQEIATNVDQKTITRWLTIKPYLRAKDPAAYLAHALTKAIPVPTYAIRARQQAEQVRHQQRRERARQKQADAQQQHQAQHHADLMAYYATLPLATQEALNAQALANLTPFCRQQVRRCQAEGQNPLDSPIIKVDFDEQRAKLLEQHEQKTTPSD